MYAEIKSNNKVLVNRLDDNEKILLQNLLNEAKEEDKQLYVSGITDEMGDFGGVFLEVLSKDASRRRW